MGGWNRVWMRSAVKHNPGFITCVAYTMTLHRLAFPCALAFALIAAPLISTAQTAPSKPTQSSKAPARKAAPPTSVRYIPSKPASPEQIDASERVFYGVYECEFNQTIDITPNIPFPAYVNVKHGKATYLMKPVLSSTGAIRLEDIRGQTLMVQIASKSMLLNVKTAQRVVDDCVSPKQRDLIDAARAAKVAAAAVAAATTAPQISATASAPDSGGSSAASAQAASSPASSVEQKRLPNR